MSKLLLKVQWSGVTEWISFDTENIPESGSYIHTREFWGGDKFVTYKAEFNYQIDNDKNHILQLKYYQELNEDLINEIGIHWGTSTIEIKETLKSAIATWVGNETGEEFYGDTWDGEADVVTIIQAGGPRAFEYELIQRLVRDSQFRENLLEVDQCCAITGESTKKVLQAAHVFNVEDGGADAIDNGILLRADLHLLFDAHFFTIDDSGKVIPSHNLSKNYVDLLKSKAIDKQIFDRCQHNFRKKNEIKVEN